MLIYLNSIVGFLQGIIRSGLMLKNGEKWLLRE